MRRKFSKVIVGSDQQDLPIGHHAMKEWLAGGEPGRELGGWIDIRIEFTSQCILRWHQRTDHVL